MSAIAAKPNTKNAAYWDRKITPGKVLIYLALLIVFLITAYPFFYILSLSVMPYDRYVTQPIHLLPNGFTTLYFDQILHDSRLVRAFTVSAIKTSAGTILSVLVTILGGYALSRPNLK